MPPDFTYLQSKKFAVVFVNSDGGEENVKLRVLHGRANITDKGYLACEHREGQFVVPASCYPNILPSDGTDLLEDAEYYVICRVSGMEL